MPRSVHDAMTGELGAIFFTVSATGGIDGRGLFASTDAIRNVTYQGLLNLVAAASFRQVFRDALFSHRL